jgi:3-oxoacyl-[acyl-carrier protein] reductase
MNECSTNRRLGGRVAIVTGGGGGIGRAEAILIAQQGAQVVVSDIAEQEGVPLARVVADEILARGGQALAAVEDLSTFKGAERTVAEAVEAFGRLDILLNNAGRRVQKAVQDYTEEDYELVLGSHLRATFAMTKYATPVFLTRGSGVILNTSSESGLGQPYNVAYAAAKEAITGMTRSLARELGPFGIRCNQIRPRASVERGADFAEMSRRYAAQRAALGRYALGLHGDRTRPSRPEDVAAVAVWLCTDAARILNGCDLFVIGGEVGLWSEPDLERSVIRENGWTLDALDEVLPATLIRGMENRYSGGGSAT